MTNDTDEFEPFMALPQFMCQQPPIMDKKSSATTGLQMETIGECLPLLTAINNQSSDPFDFDENGLPYLLRSEHIDFVKNGLQPLPSGFVALDASRPWLMYWSLLSLHVLGEDVTKYSDRYAWCSCVNASSRLTRSF